MADTHAPAICTVCHAELPFIEYGSKIGKNGQMAKWPVYEKCKNPDCSAGRKHLGMPKEEVDYPQATKPLKPATSGDKYRLYQLMNMINGPLIFDDMYDACEGKVKVVMVPEDMEKVFEACQKSSTVQAEKVNGEVVLHMGIRSLTIMAADWHATRGYGYYKLENNQ